MKVRHAPDAVYEFMKVALVIFLIWATLQEFRGDHALEAGLYGMEVFRDLFKRGA